MAEDVSYLKKMEYMNRDTKEKLSGMTITLHWVMAITMISLLAVGIIMHEMDNSAFKFDLYHVHKSFGVVLFPIAIWRIVWRYKNGFPEPVGHYSNLEHILAKLMHYVLLIGTVLMPMSGMMMSGAGGHGIPVFFFELVSSNYVDGAAVAFNSGAAKLGKEIHEIAANLLLLAIALHVVGAIKHHLIDKDATIKRMLGK